MRIHRPAAERIDDLSGGRRRLLQILRLRVPARPSVSAAVEPSQSDRLDIAIFHSTKNVLDGWAGTLLVFCPTAITARTGL
ncbi:MAG: hypothetical protein IPJ15_10290 [Actinomycetales bacterium]|nr:hypothetical protein [Candidatus Phosphoribacter baldrii]